MSNRNVNVIVIDGNLTGNMEQNPNGTIGKFSVAVNESQKNQNGEWESYANFIPVKIFGKSVQNLSAYLTKGKRVIVNGRLHQERWEKDGRKESRLVVYANDVVFAGNHDGGQQSAGGPAGKPAADGDMESFSEDIPF